MIYKIKMTLEGKFPGSPDHNYYEVDEETWDLVSYVIKLKIQNQRK